MYVGVDYYPEHWPHDRWETDPRLMEEAGFNVVRLAEFAWMNMEPEEGRFDFAWLDEAIATLGRHGISVILGTPTAAMPAWVARKYPEVMALQAIGTRLAWGVRRNNCFSSGAYRLLSERITRAMAAHFSATPNVIGWQTDNEFTEPLCYCESCRAGFHDWLRDKYETLDRLNQAWGTHFWGQRYDAWSEIQLPEGPHWGAAGDSHLSTHNPSLCLDFTRYFSWLNQRFQHDQVRLIRELSPHQFITHNFMGFGTDLDCYAMAADLDHVSWDNYPVWGAPDIPYDASAAAALMRGLKRKNFWVMEQTAGPGGWSTFGRNPRPGEIRKIAYQQIANGADHIIWFRWRTCTAGREQYWHGLLGHDGKPGRRYREAAHAAGEFHRLADELKDTTVAADIAILYDYDNVWALRIQSAFHGNSLVRAVGRYQRALFRAGLAADMIPSTADFSAYRMIIAPELFLLPDAVAERLRAYVAAGGVLITELRTGVKDETNLCYDRTLPGLLTDTLGITIEEYEAMDDTWTYRVIGEGLPGEYTATKFADWVIPQTAEVLARYEPWHVEPYVAATRNRFEKGTAYYVGTVMKEESFYDALLADALPRAGVKPALVPPAGVEATVRRNDQRALLFLVNHTEERQTVAVPAGKQELLTGMTTRETLDLDRYGVAVVKLT